jgi:cell wall-associated NlpC family hydrolase
VIYKAIADFGDVITEAAKAKAALQSLSDSAKAEGDVEAGAAAKAAAAHKADTSAIDAERRALELLAVAAKGAQQWTAWGGRTDPGAYLADQAKILEYRRLINIQDWLTFTSPQAAYAWRERERLQAIQMNYALWGGYTTPDQYLGYLQRERTGLAGLNAELLQRAAVYKENTNAALAYANAVTGTHKTIGTLSEGLDLSGVSQFQSALTGLPDIVTTTLQVDDAAALARIAQYEALLKGIPRAETTTADVITASYALGGAPVPSALPKSAVIPVSFGGPYQEQFAGILNEVARLNGLRAEVPVHFDLPPASEITSFMAMVRAKPPWENWSLAGHLGGGGTGGGGGGPPPVAPAPGAEPPDDAAAKWAALAAVMGKAGDEAAYFGVEEKIAAAATGDAGDKAKAASPAFTSFAATLASAAGWLGIFGARIALFGGLAGTVGGIHLLIDAIIELVAIITLASVGILAAAAALGIFIAVGNLAQDTLGRISDRLKATYTAATATGQAIYPLANSFDKLASKIRPEIWQLYGDALNLVTGRAGTLGQIAVKTGTYLDQLAAKVVVFISSPGFQQGLTTLVKAGFGVLRQLGDIFRNLGQALVEFAKVAQTTHIAEDLLAIINAAAKLLDLILKLPTPILAVAVGLHGLYLWGGLLATGIVALLSPLRGLALALGGVAAAESAGGLASLGKDSSAWERLKSVITDIGNGFGALPARIGLVAKAEQDAGAAAEGAAAQTGGLSGVLAKMGGTAGLATGGLIALAAAAAAFAVLALTAKDNAQKWINSINSGLGQGSILTVIGRTMSNLAAVTGQLSTAQGLNAQATHELAGEQVNLSGKLQDELVHTAAISKAYGVNMPTALALLNTAGVKTSALFTDQSKVWAAAEVQVAGLVKGYAAMGQGLTQLQGDVSVQLVTGADQLKQMQALNTAWDTWITTVTGGESAFVKFQQDLAGTNTNARAAGASMGGLNAASLTLRSAYLAMLPDAGKVLDNIRSQSAVLQNGAQGSAILTKATKDLAAEMIPLAQGNQSARDSLLALVQEADPAVNTWQKLTKWVGKEGATQAAADLDSIMTKLETPVSNLAADAAKLTTTLQQDLNPAMATAEFNALGGQKAFSTFASDLTKFGPGSQATVQAGAQVASMLLAIDKNTATAKDQFVAWAESMGIPQKAADQLWATVYKLTGQSHVMTIKSEIGTTQKDLDNLRKELADTTDPARRRQIILQIGYDQQKLNDLHRQLDQASASTDKLRSGMAAGATASDKLASSGFFAQRGDTFRTNMQQIGTFFGKTLPDAFKTAGESVGRFFADPFTDFFTKTVPHVAGNVATFFSGPFRTAVEAAWSHVWSALVSPVVNFTDSVKHAITSGFDSWWKTHGTAVESIWNSVTGNLSMAWDNFTGGLKRAWDTFTGWFKGAGDISKPLAGSWDKFYSGAVQPVLAKIEAAWRVTFGALEAVAKITFDLITTVLKTAWDAAMAVLKTAWDALMLVLKVAWDTVVAVINVAIDLMTGHWKTAWTDVTTWFKQVMNAVWDFLRQGFNNFIDFFKQLWHNALSFLEQAWRAWWGWFDSTIIHSGFGHFLTSTLPGWFSEVVSFFENSWKKSWSWFSNTIIGGWSHLFNVQFPGWLSDIGRFFSSTWKTVWKDFSSDVIGPMGHWFSSTLPNAIHAGFRDAINWVIDNVINKVINFIDNDILKHLPGGLHISTIGNVAAGGDIGAPRKFATGSVPGPSAVDGTHILAMGGEYMLRQPARMALEQSFGPNFLNTLNQADSWLGSGSRGTLASQATQQGVNTGPQHLAVPRAFPFPSYQLATGGQIVAEAEKFIGAPYVYGGTSPSGWDCSGFVQYVLEHLGWHNVPRTSEAQYSWTSHTSNPSIGGLVFAQFPGDNASPGHVGFYVGNGNVLSARDPQWGTGIDKLASWGGHIVGYGNEPNATGLIGQILSGIGSFLSEPWQAVEGLLSATGSALGDLVKPLAGLVTGGASELLKLARQGAAAIFNGVWDHSVKPITDLVPGDSIPGALLQGSAAEIRQGIDNFLTGQDSNAQSAANAANAAGASGAIGPVSGPADAGPGQAMSYAMGQLGAHGWPSSQFSPLRSLWTRESGWNRFARNPSSGAYGIPQSLPESKLPAAGQAGGGSHASPQIDWGLGYIHQVYGDPSAAWSHEMSAGWYPFGGVVGGDGASLMSAGGPAPPPLFMASGGLADWSVLNSAVRTEMSAMDAMQAARLPGSATAAQRSAYSSWLKALWSQQLKTVGLGHSPPGAFQALASNAASPSRMTAGQWSAFTGDLSYLTREEEGPGAGGINPPGTPANSGWAAWHYLHPQWQSLLGALRTAQSRAATARAEWGTGSVPSSSSPGGTAPVGLAPEWTDAVGSVTGAIGSLNTAVVSDESPAFWKLMGENLSAIKGITPKQAGAWHAWRTALEAQQYKTFGLGHSPPGAYAKLAADFASPTAITPGMWSTLSADVGRLVSEEAGTGIKGGINPPGTPADSGYVPWHYFHPQWQSLRDALLKVQQRIPVAKQVWQNIYGPGHLPFTPGPGGTPPATSVPSGLVNVMPEATMGGPAFAVRPGTGTPDMGFAAGGGLGDVASMFSGSLSPGGTMLPLVVQHGIPDAVLRRLEGSVPARGEYPRTLSEAGAAHYGPALNVEQLNINNPLPQRPSDSIAHAANRMAFLAGRGMN